MSWSADEIVYGAGPRGIMRVSANGGMPEQIVSVESTELAASPQMLPGNRAVLFTLAAGATSGAGTRQWDTARIVVQTLGSGERKTVVESGSHARYLSTGHIVYVLGGVLFAAPFDERRLQVSGRAVPVVDGIMRGVFGNTAAQYSVSGSGSLVFVPGPVSMSAALREIVRMNRKGGVEHVPLPPNVYSSLRVSPNGRELAFGTDDGKEAIVWVYDLSGTSAPRRLTFGGGNRFPIWSGDGQRVVFQSDREVDPGLYWQRADGTGTAERLTTPDKGTAHIPESWSARARDSRSVRWRARVCRCGRSRCRKRRRYRLATFGRRPRSIPSFRPMGDGWPTRCGPAIWPTCMSSPPPPRAPSIRSRPRTDIIPSGCPTARGSRTELAGTSRSWSASTPSRVSRLALLTPVIAGGLPTVVSLGSRSYDITPDGAAFLTVTAASGSQPGSVETREIQIVLNWHRGAKAPRADEVMGARQSLTRPSAG